MIQVSRLRQAALGAIILAGSVHLSTAEPVQAAEPVPAVSCDAYALGYGQGMCAGKGQRFVSVTYSCNPDGTANIISVSCAELLPHTPG